jgi:hypothetical protein
MEHKFKIQIGDWSGDGHGKHEDFIFTSNKPIEAVREAYFVAKRKISKVCPENYCSDYGDGDLTEDVRAMLRNGGCPLPENPSDFNAESMARVVAWFCMQGDPDLRIDAAPGADIPTLAFYGHDAKRRHIGFIGYGLMGE